MKRIDLVKTGGFQAGVHLRTQFNVPVPAPNAHQVLLQVKASAVNPVDWKMAEYGFLLPDPLPAALGCDVAGVVVKASGTHAHLLGQRVVTYLGANKAQSTVDQGAYVEQVVVDADLVAALPDAMSFAEATTFPVGALTADLLLRELSLQKGDWVLVWGASSSVGYFAVQRALARGYRVIAVASGSHEAALTELHVTAFVDYRKGDVVAQILAVGGDEPLVLNGAVDCIGGPDTFGTCAQLVHDAFGPGDTDTRTTTLVVSTTNSMGLPTPPGNVQARPVDLGTALDKAETREFVRTALPEIIRECRAMKVRSVVGPMAAETVQEAFQVNKDGVSGEKVVIEWN
ncbi:alcohol dehydrogenase [Phaeodactylum tricornutum CCAP 1055/1]|jgi:NADPH:quinone reductase-like Zn-dependent oxidoreductase|uniref:Alcohol dehydrogenase n=2 Tax=Phaeodactylum tricornutum TaxID=2850 RepID=B7S4B2_PHATC|nr:alcohol dehydrogenase [Phaeodactylum tricornutum CCAP 1055/1]EEC42599.1 alcohol dehydrogenase [Phaeodactylum tricornutum CCAP 1055/1]|eukprot:XP_002176363.1 alcohol dehydrogenase [Phaeodactylum tricornutum CCAP 1055/1]